MKSRLWYPQLDIASTARRLLRILYAWQDTMISTERLLILDFFLASPALIGDIKMPGAFRKQYGTLNLPKKKDQFVVLPPSSLLFHSMLPIQKKALLSLVAKNLVNKEEYDLGKVSFTDAGKQTASTIDTSSDQGVESRALSFLCGLMASDEFSTKLELRSRTELRHYD
jgi:hypothetical protein